ncbi:MAG: anaerobic glycerol-3-phosphate dehydrogenase subunit GlpA [Peptococcales bacterium]|jgi:glycerol-3-phosphate dehydrogenase
MINRVQVVVIGGGATGTGILRDLALRGIECLLVEQNDLATGTSGRFHGLLHSGARYVVKDLHSAQECIQENMILKQIAPDCIEDMGGMFIATKNDDLSYVSDWLEGCQRAGISTREVSPGELLQEEPALNPDVVKAYFVPDAAVDGFTLAAANALAATKIGAQVKTYTKVVGFKVEEKKVCGIYLKNKHTGEEEFVECDYVINAGGAWAGEIAALAGANIKVSPDKGVLVIFNHRITNRVLNHLRPPGDGDIFVPHGSVTVFGTTSRLTNNPDDNEATREEVLELLKEGTNLIPGLRDMRLIRAFAGVRPLYQPDGGEVGREATRDFTLIDHSELTGLKGFLSVVGGKLTTYRLMAKACVDVVAPRLGNDKPCITHQEMIYAPVPRNNAQPAQYLCQCEMVTKRMLDQAVQDKERFSLSDVRRLTRLGMGPCQGTFCTFRATGYYHESRGLKAEIANRLLKDHIEERWKGSKAILWGQQAQETQLTRGIYLGLLNLERLDSDKP